MKPPIQYFGAKGNLAEDAGELLAPSEGETK